MKLELNDQEANEMIRLIDIAVRSNGLNIAETGLYLAKKIQEAMKLKEESKENV